MASLAPLNQLIPLQPLQPLGAADTQPERVEAAVSSDFWQALRRIQAADANAHLLQQQLVQGEAVDLHEVMVQTAEASLMISAAVEVRNRIHEAYQELMRMTI